MAGIRALGAVRPELLRFKDRHQREFVIGPTHEEVITDAVRRDVKSYRQLPIHLYQIQTKFRDEIRPRFGVMRGREFLMKDGYSFHTSFEDLKREYRNMYETYSRIFTRLGLKFRAVAADTGSIGGTGSHEFHVLADSGEDDIAFCPDSDYAANVELAEALAPATPRAAAGTAMAKIATPGKMACADVAELPRRAVGQDRQVDRRDQRKGRRQHDIRPAPAARRPRTERNQGRQDWRPDAFPLRLGRARSRNISAASPAISARLRSTAKKWRFSPTARSPR